MAQPIQSQMRKIGGIDGPRQEIWVCMDDVIAQVFEKSATSKAKKTREVGKIVGEFLVDLYKKIEGQIND